MEQSSNQRSGTGTGSKEQANPGRARSNRRDRKDPLEFHPKPTRPRRVTWEYFRERRQEQHCRQQAARGVDTRPKFDLSKVSKPVRCAEGHSRAQAGRGRSQGRTPRAQPPSWQLLRRPPSQLQPLLHPKSQSLQPLHGRGVTAVNLCPYSTSSAPRRIVPLAPPRPQANIVVPARCRLPSRASPPLGPVIRALSLPAHDRPAHVPTPPPPMPPLRPWPSPGSTWHRQSSKRQSPPHHLRPLSPYLKPMPRRQSHRRRQPIRPP